MEITWDDVKTQEKDSYLLIDIREYEHSALGMVPGAIAISFIEDVNKLFELPKEKKIYLYEIMYDVGMSAIRENLVYRHRNCCRMQGMRHTV